MVLMDTNLNLMFNMQEQMLLYTFFNRYVNVWNKLPLNCVNTNVTTCFKQKLHNFDLFKYIKGRLYRRILSLVVY